MVARHKVDKQPHDGEGGFKGRARKPKMLLLCVCVEGQSVRENVLKKTRKKKKSYGFLNNSINHSDVGRLITYVAVVHKLLKAFKWLPST